MLTVKPSAVTSSVPVLYTLTAPMLAEGESGFFFSLPSASSTTRNLSGASTNFGVQAQISQ